MQLGQVRKLSFEFQTPRQVVPVRKEDGYRFGRVFYFRELVVANLELLERVQFSKAWGKGRAEIVAI